MIQTFPLRTSYPLAIREKLSRLMKMAFPTIFQPGQGIYDLNQTLDFKMPRALGGETHWWLAPSGGVDTIPAANCLAAYDAKNAISLAASYDNLAAPLNGLPDGTYDCTLGVAPTWANGTGWTFAAGKYLKTGIIPTNTSWSAILRFNNATDGNIVPFGAYQGETKAFMLWPNIAALGLTIYNGGRLSVKPSLTSGIIAVADNKMYRNGVADAGTAVAGTAPTIQLYIGIPNGLGYQYLGDVVELAVYNITLDAPTNLALYIAMAAL